MNAQAEGFTEAKILTTAASRSGIFVKKDSTVVIATIAGATMKQWGEVMLALGAVDGMNLDGGASSGMYANGKYITTPGRLLSNGLMFGKKLEVVNKRLQNKRERSFVKNLSLYLIYDDYPKKISISVPAVPIFLPVNTFGS